MELHKVAFDVIQVMASPEVKVRSPFCLIIKVQLD